LVLTLLALSLNIEQSYCVVIDQITLNLPANTNITSVVVYNNLIFYANLKYDTDTGAVILLQNQGSFWQQSAQLVSTNGNPTLAFDGINVAVGNDDQLDPQIASVFVKSDQWSQEYAITIPLGLPSNLTSHSISIFDATTIIGIPDYDYNTGAVIIYTAVPGKSYIFYGEVEGDQFGNSVYIHNNFIVIGAPGKAGGGAIYVYRNLNNVWNISDIYFNITKLQPPDMSVKGFGNSVVIGDNIIVVGSFMAESGSVFVYSIENDLYQFEEGITPTENLEYFGKTLAVYGNYLVIGSSSDLVQLYQSVSNQWNEWILLEEISLVSEVGFGLAVSIYDKTVVIASAENLYIYVIPEIPEPVVDLAAQYWYLYFLAAIILVVVLFVILHGIYRSSKKRTKLNGETYDTTGSDEVSIDEEAAQAQQDASVDLEGEGVTTSQNDNSEISLSDKDNEKST